MIIDPFSNYIEKSCMAGIKANSLAIDIYFLLLYLRNAITIPITTLT